MCFVIDIKYQKTSSKHILYTGIPLVVWIVDNKLLIWFIGEVSQQGSSENDGRSDVYTRSELKVISNCSFNNCCCTNCSNFTCVYLNFLEFT